MTLLPPPEKFDEHTLTEYVEASLLLERETHISLAELVSRFPSGQRPGSADLGLIRSEVNRRAYLFPKLYPYRADDAGVYRLWNMQLGVYDFLTLLSIERAPYRKEDRFNEANKIFDWLVREAIKTRLGPTGDGVRFGTPVQDGRPQKFEEAIPWLAERMGLATLVADLPVDDNDCGVDVVAWQPFASGRSGFPVWLIQGTVEMSYEHKAHQIPVALWRQMIDIGAPSTALAIPFAVRDGDDRWLKVTLAVTSLLDRTRMCDMLEHWDLTSFPEWTEMMAFIAGEIDKMPAAIRAAEVVAGASGKKAKPPRVPNGRTQRASGARDPLRR